MNRLYILLQRAGDLIAALPILKVDADEGRRPSILVHYDYLPVLSGIGYVDPIVFEGDPDDLDAALAKAKSVPGLEPCSLQVIGQTEVVKRCTYEPAGFTQHSTDSFAKEPFKLAGRAELLRTQPRPVFDRRDFKREAALIKKARCKPENTIFVATSGTTSPFPYKDLLLELLRLRFRGKIGVCDLSKLRAEQIYDFLGLFERALCLVACDSALLHLSYAVPALPVVALIQDKPSLWHGSPWRVNHIAHIRYSDFAARAVEMLDAIERLGEPGCWFAPVVKGPRIIHAWSGYEVFEANRERHCQARETWLREYQSGQWIETQVELGAIGRDSKYSNLKDNGRFPFLKDVLRPASYRASNDSDILCLTRCDTFLTEDFTERLLSSTLPVWCHRTWRNGHGDTFHPQIDLFAFTVGWFKEYHRECLDVVLGRDPYWGRMLYDICKRHGGSEMKGACYVPKYQALRRGQPPMREVYNEKLFLDYEAKVGPVILFPKVTEQLPGTIINRHALHPWGYNPSLIRWEDRWLMAYRWHDQGDYSTALAIAELDEQFQVKSRKDLQLPPQGGSEEDAKFFVFNGKLCLSYVDSTYPLIPPKAVVKYGRLIEDTVWTLQNVQVPKLPGNDGMSCQKNYVFFEHQGKMFCIYQCYPQHRVFEVGGEEIGKEHTSCGLTWPFGEPRGGTVPLPYKDKLLRFFHSPLDNEPGLFRRRYYVGAMLIEPEPPFAPVAISKEPVLRGSEDDHLSMQERASILHFKSKVAFPGGAVANEGGWLLAIGANDCACVLVKVSEKDLKL